MGVGGIDSWTKLANPMEAHRIPERLGFVWWVGLVVRPLPVPGTG